MKLRTLVITCAPLILLAGLAGWWIQSPTPVVVDDELSTDPIHREFTEVAQQLTGGFNPWLGSAQVGHLQAMLGKSPRPFDQINIRTQLGWELLRLGKTDEAIEQYKLAEALLEEHPLRAPRDFKAHIGLAYWRLAEVSNCIENHRRDCCVFPLAGGGLHDQSEPAARAREYLLAHLQEKPDDRARQWLLNIVAMALDQYPDGVPEAYRLPPQALRSDRDVPRFQDVAGSLGIDAFNLCGGVIADDFTGDGLIDIVTSSYDPNAPLLFYVNTGDGYEDRSDQPGLKNQLGGLNCIAADYDNDRDLDILVLRGAWLHEEGRIRNSLLENDGQGRFRDVTHQAGLAFGAYPTQAAVWGDFDNDGDLDLFIGNESRPDQGAHYPSELFRNNGDGTFTDIAGEAGVTNDRYCKGVTAGDYDNDGDLDLYVSNIGANRLYVNQGDATFVDMAEQAGVVEPSRRSFATWFFDYDNDGWLDLFVAAYDSSLDDIASDFLGMPHEGESPKLYRNRGNCTFEEVSAATGLDHPSLPMGANFGDMDNDGWLDIYLTTGDPDYATLTPNVMYRNDRGRRFENVTTSGGFGHLQKGHGVAFADYDSDGDQDIYHQLGGFYPGDKFRNALLQNPGNANRFLVVTLAGQQSNSFALGARVRVKTIGAVGDVRQIHRSVGSVSSFGGSPLRQEIGLGQATSISELEIVWPVTGERQVFYDIPPNSWVQITEGDDRAKISSQPAGVPRSTVP